MKVDHVWLVTAALLASGCGGAPAPAATVPITASIPDGDPAAITDEGVVRVRVEVGPDMPTRGPSDAPVTWVIFGDLECPFTTRLMPVLEALEAEHPGRIRVVWRDHPLPFHEHADEAAEAAREAFVEGGSEGFWRFLPIVLENRGALETTDLEGYAFTAGLSPQRIRVALRDIVHVDHVEADLSAGARAGVTGTPTSFLNGRIVVGAQPYDVFADLVEDELARAEARYAEGVPADRYYAALMRGALEEAPPSERVAEGRGDGARRRARDPAAIYAVPVSADHPVRGPIDALVTIVELSDFQCPFCARAQPTIERLVAAYGSDVRIVFRHNPLPFHDRAMPAALLSRAVFLRFGAERFWALHDALLENSSDLSEETLIVLGTDAGLTAAEVRAAIDEPEDGPLHAGIDADQALATALDARSTPSFFINGRLVQGAQRYEAFATVVDEELARARALIASGTPRAGIYDAAIAGGASAPVRLVDGDPPTAAPPTPTPAPSPSLIPAPPDVARIPAGAARTASGIGWRILRPGTGTVHPTTSSRVRVHYTGWTTDGRMFDSSRTRGAPATFPLSGVIPGWTEAVQLMVEGEERRVWIPARLAYGDGPREGMPTGMLVFDIELLAIEP